MDERELIAKKQLYEAKKIEILDENHDEEISIKVLAFREEKEKEILAFEQSLKSEIDSQKSKDLTKVEHYLELINILIEEAKTNSIELSTQDVSQSISQETQSVDSVIRPTSI